MEPFQLSLPVPPTPPLSSNPNLPLSAPAIITSPKTIRNRRSPTKPRTPNSLSNSSSTSNPLKPKSATTPVAASSRKQKATFTTCRSYPEHALPTLVIPLQEEGELKRNQRRSKQEALARMDKTEQMLSMPETTGTSFLPAPQPTAGPSIARNPLNRPRIINPPFDISTVRTEAPRYPEPRTTPRLFGLQECPVFYPDPEEFRDPMAYIDSIGHIAKPFGICKIVPPEGWKMPFSLETDTFRFKTRLQKLNSLEAASRAKINFLEQIALYHSQQGDPDVSIPFIDHSPVDLWRLRKEVNKAGGYDETTRTHAWSTVAIVMGFEANHGTELQTHYRKIIRPFEDFAVRAKSMSGSPLTPLSSAGRRGTGFPGQSPETPSQGRMGGMRSVPSRMGGGGPSPMRTSLSLPQDENAFLAKMEELPRSASTSAIPTIKLKVPGFVASDGSESELSEEEPPVEVKPVISVPTPYEKGEVCEVCRGGHHEKMILLCDGCDRGFHTYCLDPPLDHVPDNEEWYCTSCLLGTGEDFGFDEGEEHSIPSFQARDAGFAAAWFNGHKPPPREPDDLSRRLGKCTVGEEDVEREFWRLVNSSEETVEIEYGADVHSTTHGSGAPTLETHPGNAYAADPWNLNNMPILPESLLRYIKSDISGMTVPWIYLGMLFSTFCWHNEDHYTYSVNYMYWGETKTWYGIPGSDAHKFEDAIQSEAPELFEQQPTLLYDLVTMMNPGKLTQKGVKVVACDQRPNEFVITFPKAYHCGFNHGINFNEAVNFALPDWLADGKDCVTRYQDHIKAPVFSHDELLVTITLYSDTIRTALWLKDSLTRMVAEESARREENRARFPTCKEVLVEEDCPEDQYQCCICKGFCYLSQMTCSCTKSVSCLDHASQLCACPADKRVLRMRYSENQLEEILRDVTTRANIPKQWRDRFDTLLEAPKPPLKSLRSLLADGEKIDHPIPEVADLRAFVERSNAWVERVASLSTRKPTARRRKGRQDEMEEDLDRSPQALSRLMEEAKLLAFESEEIRYLGHILASITNFRNEATKLLATPEDEVDLEKCRSVLIVGNSLNVDLPEISSLTTLVNRLSWFHKVEEEVDDQTLQIGEIVALLEEAEENDIPEHHPTVIELRKREKKGLTWKSEVEKLLKSKEITIDEISILIDNQDYTPVSIDLMRQLEGVRKTAQGWQTSATSILTSGGSAIAATRLCKAVRSASGPLKHIDIPEIGQLQLELDQHTKWLNDLAGYLGCTPSKANEELKRVLTEFENHLNPMDDNSGVGSSAFACFCRQAPDGEGKMVQCSGCKEQYHIRCVGKVPKSQSFSCEMCAKPVLEDRRPSIEIIASFADPSRWRWRINCPEIPLIDSIVQCAKRYATVILPIINPFDEVPPCRDPKLIEHHLRKLYNIPLRLDVRHKTSSFIVEDWLDARLDQALKHIEDTTIVKPEKARRRRRGIFEIASARPGYFYCVCKTPAVPGDEQPVVCQKCDQSYHVRCLGESMVAEMTNSGAGGNARGCPICCIKAAWQFPANNKGGFIALQMLEDVGTNIYVDYKSTLVNFLQEPFKLQFSRPFDGTIIPLQCSGYTPPKESGLAKADTDILAMPVANRMPTPVSQPKNQRNGDHDPPDPKKRKVVNGNGHGNGGSNDSNGDSQRVTPGRKEKSPSKAPNGKVHMHTADTIRAASSRSPPDASANGYTLKVSAGPNGAIYEYVRKNSQEGRPEALQGVKTPAQYSNGSQNTYPYPTPGRSIPDIAPLSFAQTAIRPSPTMSTMQRILSTPLTSPLSSIPNHSRIPTTSTVRLTPPASQSNPSPLVDEKRRGSSGSREEPIVINEMASSPPAKIDDDDIVMVS